MKLSRSIHAGRLAGFSEFVFADAEATRVCGRWRELFGQRIGDRFDGRVILEIGCFDARFLSTIAAAHSGTAFVGLDWKCKPLCDGADRIVEQSIRNVALLRARAQDIARLFSPGELDEIWIFHPEPCAEPRQRKNRLLAAPFICDARRALSEGGSIHLKTDHREYYESTLATISDPAFHSPDFWNDPAALARTRDRAFAGHVTVYEQRFLKKKQPIYYVEYAKGSR